MAKGYSAGKAGAKYCLGRAGKRNSLYKARDAYSGILGTGKGIYDPANIIGTDGASLLGGYDFGKGMMDALLKGYTRQGEGYKPGDGPAMLRMADRKYEKKDEKSENEKPCLMCGAPAVDGSPFCIMCLSKN
jgi:hypothetical protein